MSTVETPPEQSPVIAAPVAPQRQPPYMVRAISRGWYPDAPGRHFGLADKQGWSIRHRVREQGEVFQLRHLRHFSPPSPIQPGMADRFGWMEWADEPSTMAPEAPQTTVPMRIQDPLSLGRDPVMVDRPGEPMGQRGPWPGAPATGPQPNGPHEQARQAAERMALSGVKQPAPPQDAPRKGK
jgi:hypothetical protein